VSANAENIKTQINQFIRNYAVEAFHNMRLNAILLQMVDLCDVTSGGNGGTQSILAQVTSANFINATDCPLTTFAGKNIAVFFNENNKFIEKDASEWDDLPGGGFKVLIPGFDSSAANFHFYVYVL
jgi:hypothetical protein